MCRKTKQLVQHIEAMIYTKVYDICVYVAKTFEIQYTVSGMTKWLKEKGFSHKQPKMIQGRCRAARSIHWGLFKSCGRYPA